MVLHAPKQRMTGSNLLEIVTKKFHYSRMFAIRNFLLFALRYSSFAILYLLFGITCSNYMKNEQRIFDNYVRHFLENISSSINHSLTLFLSALPQYCSVDQYIKLRKGNYQYVFIVLYTCLLFILS